jgi:hypothetical protein
MDTPEVPNLLDALAAELERRGHVTAKGNRYSAAAVPSMLRSA